MAPPKKKALDDLLQTLSDAWTFAQQDADRQLRQFTGQEGPNGMPSLFGPTGNGVASLRSAFGVGPGAADVLVGRAYQTLNPFTGDEGMETPAMHKAGLDYTNAMGDVAGPALQFAAQLPPQIPQMLGPGELVTGAKVFEGASPLVKGAAGFIANQMGGAAQSALSAPAGERSSAFYETATDPRMAVANALGAHLSVREPHVDTSHARVKELQAKASAKLEQLMAQDAPRPPSEIKLERDPVFDAKLADAIREGMTPTNPGEPFTQPSARSLKRQQLEQILREAQGKEPVTDPAGQPTDFNNKRPVYRDPRVDAMVDQIEALQAERPTIPGTVQNFDKSGRPDVGFDPAGNREARQAWREQLRNAHRQPTELVEGRSEPTLSQRPPEELPPEQAKMQDRLDKMYGDQPLADMPRRGPMRARDVQQTQPGIHLMPEFDRNMTWELDTHEPTKMSRTAVDLMDGNHPTWGSDPTKLNLVQRTTPVGGSEPMIGGGSGPEPKTVGNMASEPKTSVMREEKTSLGYRQGIQRGERAGYSGPAGLEAARQFAQTAMEPKTMVRHPFFGPELPPEPRVVIDNPAALEKAAPPGDLKMPLPNELHLPVLGAMHVAGKELYRAPGLLEKVRQQLGLAENRADNRGDVESAYAIRQSNAAKRMGEVQLEHVYPAVQKEMDAMTPEQRLATKKVIKSIRDTGHGDLGALPPSFQNLFEKLQRQQDHQRLYLAKANYFRPSELETFAANAAQGKRWLTRDFLRFFDEKHTPPPDVQENVAVRLIEEARKNGVAGYNMADAFADIRALLKEAPNDNRTSEQRLANSSLRQRGILKKAGMPDWMRPLFGVIDDPAFVVAQSSAELARLFHIYKATQAMTSPEFEGKVWNRKWQQGMDERRVGGDMDPYDAKKLYGEFAGKYVTPEVYEALHEVSPQANRNLAWALSTKLNSIFRVGKVLLSPVTYLRNWLGNSMYLAAMGGAGPMSPKYLGRAASAMHGYSQHALGDLTGTPGHWMAKAIEDGAVRPGRGTDLSGGEAQWIVKNILKEAEKGELGPVDWMTKQLGKGKKWLGQGYELLDTHYRLAGYIAQVEKGLALGLSEQQSRMRATSLVNRYFASGASISPMFRQMAERSFGLAPFISWHVDNIRVAKNIMTDAAKGNFGPMVRVAMWWAAPMAAFATLRHLTGQSDEEVQAAEGALSAGFREQNPVYDFLPVRMKDGSNYAVSFDAINPFTTFLRGDAGGDQLSAAGLKTLPQRVAANLLAGMTESGWLEPGMDAMLEQAGLQKAKYKPDILPGQEGYALATTMWNYYMPQLVRQFEDAKRRTEVQNLRPGEELYGPVESALKGSFPFRFNKVGERSRAQAVAGNRAQDRELAQTNLKRVGGMLRRGQVDPAEAERLKAASREELEKRRKQGK